MFNARDPQLLQLRDLCVRAKRHMDRDLWEDALTVLNDADDLALRLDAGRTWIRYVQAICLDLLDRRLDALDFVHAALELDPSSAPAWGSRNIIIDRVRERVRDAEVSVPDRMAAYQKLAGLGLASYEEHIAQIELLRASSRSGEALQLALTVAKLCGPSAEISALLAQLEPVGSS